MSKKHKTLKEKRQASLRKTKYVQLPADEKKISSSSSYAYKAPEVKKAKEIDEDSLLTVGPAYIKKDLIKTGILIIIFLGIICGINWWVNNGGMKYLGLN
jgi:hypothetical protein